MYRVLAVAAAMLLCAAGTPDRARAADIKVLAPGSTENSFGVLVPQFTQSSGHTVTVGYGVFVRKGDPKPDISTEDAFLHAVANAKSIAYADPKLGGSSSIVVAGIIDSLDITGSIRP